MPTLEIRSDWVILVNTPFLPIHITKARLLVARLDLISFFFCNLPHKETAAFCLLRSEVIGLSELKLSGVST